MDTVPLKMMISPMLDNFLIICLMDMEEKSAQITHMKVNIILAPNWKANLHGT